MSKRDLTIITTVGVPAIVKGTLSRVMIEVSQGVFVSSLSQRSREALWNEVVPRRRAGALVMVYPDVSDTGMRIVTAGSVWETVDLDGLLLVERYPDNLTVRERRARLSRNVRKL